VFGRDTRAAELAGKNLVHPWPDPEVSDREFIYLDSTRFDKFFRMNCEMELTARPFSFPLQKVSQHSDFISRLHSGRLKVTSSVPALWKPVVFLLVISYGLIECSEVVLSVADFLTDSCRRPRSVI
jgi:hypothetical protein